MHLLSVVPVTATGIKMKNHLGKLAISSIQKLKIFSYYYRDLYSSTYPLVKIFKDFFSFRIFDFPVNTSEQQEGLEAPIPLQEINTIDMLNLIKLLLQMALHKNSIKHLNVLLPLDYRKYFVLQK